VAEASRAMLSASADAIAVMRDRDLFGVMTASDALKWMANGGSASQSVDKIMSDVPPPGGPQTSVSDCVLAIARSGISVAALTANGTPNGGLLRLVTTADLQPAFGDNPITLLRQIAHATDIEALRVLHLRARAFLLDHLDTPSAVEWLASLADRINVSIVTRLLDLAGAGEDNPIHRWCWCWCFWGAAGRCELLTAMEPGIAVLCPEPDDVAGA